MSFRRVVGVNAVWLPVTNVERSIAFYTQTLGLNVHRRQDDWAELDSGVSRIGLTQSAAAGGDGAVVALKPVGGLDAAVTALLDAGTAFEDVIVSDRPWGRTAAFRDPDGNALEFYEPSDR